MPLGSEFPAEISLSPLVTEDGILALAVVRDVSERQRAAGQQAKLVLAEDALHVRDEFISTASHELRTPLTSLQLRADSLKRLAPKLSDATRADPILESMLQKVERIGSSTGRIAALITNLLDISRITNGKLELQRALVDLSAIARNVVEECRDEAATAGSLIQFDAPHAVTGEWDDGRLEQILVNLVSNAIKYGSSTAIDVSVTQPTENTARIVVRDHGIGIAMGDQSRIFQRFERVVSPRNYSGFGLGLWIVQRIVEVHGGEIDVESGPGCGATFTVDLPRKPPGAP